MTCRTGCLTQNHDSWGECARAADIQIDRHALQHSRRAERDKDNRLATYERARKDGLQPRSTQWPDVRAALDYGGVAPTPIVPAGTVAVTEQKE